MNAGNEIIVSEMEHSSNILLCQTLCEEKYAVLKVITITDSEELHMDEYKKLLSAKTKLIAFSRVSNLPGTENSVKAIIAIAHSQNSPVLMDNVWIYYTNDKLY